MTPGVRRQVGVLVCLALVAGAVSAKASAAGRIGVGVLVLATFATIVFANRKLALTLTLVWLVMLGFTRRMLIPFAGWSTHDPLLLFGPAAGLLLWVAVSRGPESEPAPGRTGLFLCSGFLVLWAIAQILNPAQANITVNLEGSLLYYVAPLVWFFVARRMRDDEQDRVLDVIVAMSPIVLFYGLWQSFVGFFPMDLHWVGIAGFGPAIFLPGFKLRPWSVFTSPQEYGVFCAILAIVCLSRALTTTSARWRLLYTALFALSGMALFLQSSRGTFLTFLLGVLVTVVVRLRSPAVTLMALAFAALFGLVVASHAKPTTFTVTGSSQASVAGAAAVAPGQSASAATTGGSTSSELIQHQLAFFDNPDNTTLGIHEAEIFGALGRSITHPLGLGSSVGTLAGTKGGDTVPSAESDVANVAQAFGVPGLVAYLLLMVAGFVGAVSLYARTRSSRHLAWLGILVVALDQWWQGSLYCTTALVFLVLGGIAREVVIVGAAERRPALLQPAWRGAP